MDNRISAISVGQYDVKKLTDAVARHFDLFSVWDDLRTDMRVLLKPNLLMRRLPEQASTTHPALVEAVVLVLQEKGIANIVLADSPGGPYNRMNLDGVYASCGMRDLAQRLGITLNTTFEFKERECAQAELCRNFSIIKPVTDADYIINLPKLKTHGMMTVSAGVKNLFGCIPGLQKPELHFRFPDQADFGRMLVDLSLLVKPSLTLVDAVVSMEGDGPSAGDIIETGWTFCAKNVYALDLGLCDYMDILPAQVETVVQSIKGGLCPESAALLQWMGDGMPPTRPFKLPVSTHSLNFTSGLPAFLRPAAQWIEKKLLTSRPSVRKKDCIGCGKCVESCAPKAMMLQNRKAQLDISKCIRCYCCHEMCPVKAIDIRRAGIWGI